jgi:hypothetical protein
VTRETRTTGFVTALPGALFSSWDNCRQLDCHHPRRILEGVRSNVARAVERRRAEQMATLTAAERVALVLRLAREGLAVYMTTHQADRRTATRHIKATRRLGRRYSASAAADEH